MNFLYFVDNNYVEPLRLSIKSLKQVKPDANVTVYTDITNPVQDVDAKIIERKNNYGPFRSPGGQFSEILAFWKHSDTDYVCKVDADTVWQNDEIFNELDADIVGDPVAGFAPFKYFQGGCYFLKGSFLQEIDKVNLDLWEDALEKVNNSDIVKSGQKDKQTIENLAEDQVLFNFYSQFTDDIKWVRFMDKFGDIEGSVKHFHGPQEKLTKKMEQCYEKNFRSTR